MSEFLVLAERLQAFFLEAQAQRVRPSTPAKAREAAQDLRRLHFEIFLIAAGHLAGEVMDAKASDVRSSLYACHRAGAEAISRMGAAEVATALPVARQAVRLIGLVAQSANHPRRREAKTMVLIEEYLTVLRGAARTPAQPASATAS